MRKFEQYVLVFLGFFIFEVVFIRLGFFFSVEIGPSALISAFLIYVLSLAVFNFLVGRSLKDRLIKLIPLIGFVISSLGLFGLSFLLADTYDTSWDGQGYHQTAVIALARGWNPVKEASLDLKQHLPSQIFAEGYPSALWEIEASIYALTDKINSAKVVNIAIGILSGAMVYMLLRKLSLGKIISSFTALLVVLQPVYVLQLLTFMEDGFGFQLLVVAVCALVIFTLSSKAYWAMGVFLMAELLLVSTKYSHLPVAFILGAVFFLVGLNRFLNREYKLNKSVKLSFAGFILVCLVFAYLPYIRNVLAHGAAFYPTNIPELMGSVRYNNVPSNLEDKDKLSLFFYGIFSRAQAVESGDPRSPRNIAELKPPFVFTMEELKDSAGLFNNRVGSAGPLFSGIVVLALGLLIFTSFRTRNKKERYAIYLSCFCLAVIVFLSLLTPTPNLLRYVNQVQLIPFAAILPIYAVVKRPYVKILTLTIFALIGINVSLYLGAVAEKNIQVTGQINNQFRDMKDLKREYIVQAQHFYSSYVLLSEQHIPFYIVDVLKCQDIKQLAATSTTTQYCIR